MFSLQGRREKKIKAANSHVGEAGNKEYLAFLISFAGGWKNSVNNSSDPSTSSHTNLFIIWLFIINSTEIWFPPNLMGWGHYIFFVDVL